MITFLKILAVFGMVVICVPAFCRQKIQFYCQQGGQAVQLFGLQTTTVWQESFPGCTVTVYNAGLLTQPTIYSDNIGTVKANPFTSDATTGYAFFYADNGHYDIKLSGAGIVTPFTLGDYSLFDPAQNTFFVYQSIPYAASITVDASTANFFQTTLTGNITSLTVSNPAQARFIAYSFCQDGVGGHTVTFPGAFSNPPTIGTGAPANSCFTAPFYYNGANWIYMGPDSNNIFGAKIINNAGVLTLPTSTDTLMGRATSDTETNKTLTSPTINAGALSGTFSGTPTFSGQLTSTVSTGTAPLVIASTTPVNNLSLGTNSTYPAAGMTGTLGTASGGTGVGTFTSNGVLYGNGAGNVLVTAAGGAGTQCLNSVGGAAPTWGACSSLASQAWSSIVAPTGNEAFNTSTFTTIITAGAIGGAPATNIWTFNDTTGNTTTGCLLCVNTVGTSTAIPFQVTAKGTANGLKVDTNGKLQLLGTGSIDTALSTNVAFYDRVAQGLANDNASWGHGTTSFTESLVPGDGNTVTYATPNSGTLNTASASIAFTTGSGNGTANAGSLTFSTGVGGATAGGGGTFNFTSGTGGATNGSGGTFNFTSGGGGAANGTGGTFNFTSGNGQGTGAGGPFNFTSGNAGGGASSPGGGITFTSGNGSTGALGFSGLIKFQTGTGNAVSGFNFVEGNSTGGVGTTGDFIITIGAPSGAGAPGAFRINAGGTNLPSTSGGTSQGSLIPGDGTNGVAGRWLVSEGTAGGISTWHYMGSNMVHNCAFQGPLAQLTGTGADQVMYTCTVKGKQILAGKGIKVTIGWQHSAGAAAVTYKITYGGSLCSSPSDAGTGNTIFQMYLMNNPGVTNAQTCVILPVVDGSTVVGTGSASIAVDSTVDQTLQITFNVANTDKVTPTAFMVELTL